MPLIDTNGIPILGTVNPIEVLQGEKTNLEPDDHDWQVITAYALTFEEAERAGTAFVTGIEANPPIRLAEYAMLNVIGPVCGRCEQHWALVNDLPCPGVPFDQYMASLSPEAQREVVERLQERMAANGAVQE